MTIFIQIGHPTIVAIGDRCWYLSIHQLVGVGLYVLAATVLILRLFPNRKPDQ